MSDWSSLETWGELWEVYLEIIFGSPEKDDILSKGMATVGELIGVLIGMLGKVIEFLLILPAFLINTLKFIVEITTHPYEIIIFIEILILSFALIKFHNNEEIGSGYNRIIQMFNKIIYYNYKVIEFLIYGFISIFTIIFSIIRSIRG